MRTRCTSAVRRPSVCLFVCRPSACRPTCQAYLCVDSGVQYEDQVYVYAVLVRPSVCLCAVRPPVVLPVRRTSVDSGVQYEDQVYVPSVRLFVCRPYLSGVPVC